MAELLIPETGCPEPLWQSCLYLRRAVRGLCGRAAYILDGLSGASVAELLIS